MSFFQYRLALSARREMKWAQASFFPRFNSPGYFSEAVFGTDVWISGCTWYLRGLSCSTRDLSFSSSRIETDLALVVQSVIKDLAASELNEPGKAHNRTRAFCSNSSRTSKELLIDFSTEVWSVDLRPTWRTSEGSSSRLRMNSSSL